jgi:rubrerythrin
MPKEMKGFILIISGLIFLLQSSFVAAQSNYPTTTSILQTLYYDELQDHLTYMAYAQKALSENYPNIAYLFVTLASSEFIHAQNYRKVLSDLRVEVTELRKREIHVSSTKENLKNAAQAELQLVDQTYPNILEKLKPEKHETALQMTTYAFEGDRQQRDLIEKIRSGTGILFGVLVRKIEKAVIRFHICQKCGFPVSERPLVCPISKSSGANFREVEPIQH